MNKKFAIISIILVVFVVTFGSLTGVPVSSEVEESGCKANYKRYLFPKHLCQYLTSGHCATTSLNKYNAEMEVANCLCDEYLNRPSDEAKKKILQKCSLVKPDCSSSVERIKTEYCNKEGLNSFECNEDFNQNDTQDIDFICQNKEQIFYKIFID